MLGAGVRHLGRGGNRRSKASAWTVIALITSTLFALSMHASRASGAAADNYSALVAQVKRRDLSVDFGKLRLAYAQTPTYYPYDANMTKLHQHMRQKLKDGDALAAAGIAKRVLAQDYVDIDAHQVLARGKGPCADFHHAVAEKLLQSILSSGDGKTPKTAYVVVSIDEEYDLLDSLGLQALVQSLTERDGHHYDLLLVAHATGGPVPIFFNVDMPFARVAGGDVE